MTLISGVNLDEPPVRYRGERILLLARKLMDKPGEMGRLFDAELASALYYIFFLPAPLLATPSSRAEERKLKVLHYVLTRPKTKKLRKYTIADSATSMVAAAVFLEALARQLRGQGGTPSPGGEGEEGEQGQFSDAKLLEAIDKALEAVANVAQQAKEITYLAAKFTAGTGSMLTLEDSIAEVIKLAKNTDVKQVLEVLKTVEDVDYFIKRRVRRAPRGELDGYELGSDVERLVHSELAYPFDLILVKWVEGALLLYRKVLPETKGPLYVLLDKSGSMMGTKITWAKAVAIALAQRAVRERRMFIMRFFDSIPYPPIRIGRRVKGRDVVKLLEYVASIRANGGTDITRAIMTAVEDIASIRSDKGRPSDVVLITDGEDKVAVDAVKRGLARVNAKLHTIMIHGNNPDLRVLSDTYMTVTRLGREEALQVIRVE